MPALPQKKYYSFEEYLALEIAEDARYEYWDGEVFAMAGTTRRHNTLVQNLTFLLRPFARKNGCRTYAERIKQELKERRRYVYPDVIYTCDDDSDEGTWVKTPSLLIEVLSPSTEGYDLDAKRRKYFLLPSLQAYIVLAQDSYSAQVYERANDFWKYRLLIEPSDEIRLETLGITLTLADVYEGIQLQPEAD